MKQYIRTLTATKSTFQILLNGVVKNNVAQFTDLDQWVFIPAEAEDNTVIDNTTFKKTGSIEKSVLIDGPEYDEFPALRNIETKTEFPIEAVYKLPKFINYVSKDGAYRIALTGICVDFNNKAIAATDGHVLRKEDISSIVPEDIEGQYIIPKYAIRFIKAIRKQPIKKAEIVSSEDTLFFHLELENGVKYYSKLIEGPYPEYNRVFRVEDCNMQLTSNEVNKLFAAVKEITSYPCENKVKIVRVENFNLYWNSTAGKIKINTGLPFKEDFKTAYDADYLNTVLKDIVSLNDCSMIEIKTSLLGPNIYKTVNEVFVILPFRVDFEDFNPDIYKEINA